MLSKRAAMTSPNSSLRSMGSAPRTRSWKSPRAIDWSTFTTPAARVRGREGRDHDAAHRVPDDERVAQARRLPSTAATSPAIAWLS